MNSIIERQQRKKKRKNISEYSNIYLVLNLFFIVLIQAILLIFEEEFGLSETESEESLNQDVFDFLLLSKIIKKKREWYILPRSTHWVETCLFFQRIDFPMSSF